ncbi:MAG: Smr/MutS family protein [Azoarcus sp.]|nr:Smr/MutS family protein [Azoarcus sp.]
MTRNDDNPFAILKTNRPAPIKAESAPPRSFGTAAAKASERKPEDDHALFLQAVSGAIPLKADERAEIVRHRPAPMPRQCLRNDEDERAHPAVRDFDRDFDPLQAAFAGVIPLADRGRVELSARAHAPPVKVEPAEVEPAVSRQSNDPAALFHAMVGDALPLTHASRLALSAPPPPPVPRQRKLDEAAALAESLHTPLDFEDRLDSGEETAFLRPGIRRRILTDLRRGRWVAQDKIDLHGLNRDEARTALTLFLTATLAQGKRCVRVIHGKGLGSPGGVSVLRQLSRAWLAQREEILAFCQAPPHEGGAGALMVLLRSPNARRMSHD